VLSHRGALLTRSDLHEQKQLQGCEILQIYFQGNFPLSFPSLSLLLSLSSGPLLTLLQADLTIQSTELSCSLLEKNRTIEQLDGESNFHIFYLLFLSDLHRHYGTLDLSLRSDAEYRYIAPRDRLDDPTDLISLQEKVPQLITALETIGIDSTLQKQLFEALAGVLLLGNISFKAVSDLPMKRGTNLDDIECCVDETDPLLSYVARLLGKEDIANILTAKVIQGLAPPPLPSLPSPLLLTHS
jgi:hypothetical protein